jgi:hypothetical protein
VKKAAVMAAFFCCAAAKYNTLQLANFDYICRLNPVPLPVHPLCVRDRSNPDSYRERIARYRAHAIKLILHEDEAY